MKEIERYFSVIFKMIALFFILLSLWSIGKTLERIEKKLEIKETSNEER